MEPNQFVQEHPVLVLGMYNKTIPLGMHGDANGFTEHETLLMLSWSSVLGIGNTRSKRFLCIILLTTNAPGRLLMSCLESLPGV